MNFFVEQGENAMNLENTVFGMDVCSEKGRKLNWMHETRIRSFMQVELQVYRHELDRLNKMLSMRSQQLPRRGLPTYAPTHCS